MSRSRALTKTTFSTSEIISFVRKLNPATFVYKDTSEDPRWSDIETALSTNNTEYVQLGLIADDIKDDPLFNYIGSTMEYDKVVESEEVDETTHEVLKSAVTERATTLGLKSIPLAVLGLVVDKYLINKVEELTAKVEELSSKISQ